MVRYRDLLSLTENHTLSWIDLYNQHLVEINDDPNDLIGPAVDDIQEVDGNDSDEEDDDTPQEAYELRTDWMLLAEMMPNRQTRSLDDFSARDIDRNHDWVNESLLRYPKIEEVESFIQQAIGNNEVTQVGNNSSSIDLRIMRTIW